MEKPRFPSRDYVWHGNVMGKFMKKRPDGKRQTREPTKDNFDSS